MSNPNQIKTNAATSADLRLPYKQEVGGSSPSAPTISQQLTPPPVQDDPLPSEGSGSLSGTYLGQAERYRAVVLTGATRHGPHGTETRLPHDQATFLDPVTADKWLTDRVAATGKAGVLLVQREELVRWVTPRAEV